MWAAAVIGAIQLGLAIYTLAKSSQSKPSGYSTSSGTNLYSQSQKALDTERQSLAASADTERNAILNARATEMSLAGEIYRDPQSRFMSAVGINKKTGDQLLKQQAAHGEQSRQLLGTQLTIDHGKADTWKAVQAIKMEKYKSEMEQYNKEQEAWGSAMSSGLGNITDSFYYNDTKIKADPVSDDIGDGIYSKSAKPEKPPKPEKSPKVDKKAGTETSVYDLYDDDRPKEIWQEAVGNARVVEKTYKDWDGPKYFTGLPGDKGGYHWEEFKTKEEALEYARKRSY
jgi:hypothetical protein